MELLRGYITTSHFSKIQESISKKNSKISDFSVKSMKISTHLFRTWRSPSLKIANLSERNCVNISTIWRSGMKKWKGKKPVKLENFSQWSDLANSLTRTRRNCSLKVNPPRCNQITSIIHKDQWWPGSKLTLWLRTQDQTLKVMSNLKI